MEKRVIIFMMLLVLGTNILYGKDYMYILPNNYKKIDIHRKKLEDNINNERSLRRLIIEAAFHSDLLQVEVFLYNIGEAAVSIIDAYGQIVDSTTVNTDTYVSVWLTVPETQGTYRLIITSSTWYAEGTFTVE